MNWQEVVYPNGICPVNYTINFSGDKKHYLSIGPSKYTENLWYIWYYVGGFTEIKDTYTASNLEEAKSIAITRIKDRAQLNINYYQRLLNAINEKTG